MKSTVYNNFSLALIASMVAMGAFAQSFTVKGTIKGIKDGTKVTLHSEESGRRIDFQTLSKDSSFVITGNVESPLLATIEISDKPESEYKKEDYPENRGIRFMLENADYTVSAACIDSVPRTYAVEEALLLKTPNMSIEGGEAQRQYMEWFEATYKQQLAENLADNAYRHEKYFSGKKFGDDDPSKVKPLEEALAQAQEALDKANDDFIAAHPDYAISLLMQQKKTSRPFTYTVAELDSLLKTFADNYDKVRFETFTQTANQLKKYPWGAQYTDIALQTPEGESTRLADYIEKGKFNFIDFWASWCGPCRAAIPNVKEMYQLLGDKVNIISVSVDRKNEDWQKAMKEENMPWRQLITTKEGTRQLGEDYMLQYVPTLIVIDHEGHIQMYTNEPDKAHRYLEEHVK